MPDVLLDTNIVVYLFKKEKKYIDFLNETYGDKTYGISIVTYMEALIGAHDDREEQTIRAHLDQFEIITLSVEIARQTAMWIRRRKQKGLRDPGISDTLIGQTAFVLGVPLVTNNPKDFSAFKELELRVP